MPAEIIDNNLQVHPLIESILSHTLSSICVSLYNHNICARQQDIYNLEPLKAFHLVNYIINSKNIHRVLVSTGVTFKTHLTSYGGLGYSAVFEELLLKYFTENN